MSTYLPVLGLKGTEVGGGELGVAKGAIGYVNTGSAEELNKLSVDISNGAVAIVGGLTESLSEWVVTQGCILTATKETEPKVALSAGTLKNRLTGAIIAEVAAFSATKEKSTISGKDRYDIIEAKISTGANKYVEGTPAATGKAALPTLDSGYAPVATLFWSGVTEEPVLTVQRT